MNVYELSFGHIKHFVVASSERDEGDETSAYTQGQDPEAFPDLHFRPFEIRKVEVEGYTIAVTPDVQEGVESPRRGGRRKVTA